ncbi:hypothetical protein [Robertmurraya siralis]|uniref:hypothetical protein n=1 Tax=Robertmurraya siralis TaxID=77777 RepID=UPI0010F69271|nr:hypothetical protein [Robertmurraya siralis]
MDIIMDVINLEIYDEKGRHVVTLDTLNKSQLFYDLTGRNTYLGVTDVAFRTEILKQLGEVVKEDISDFNKSVTEDNNELKIKFKKHNKLPKFKLVGRGVSYDAETNRINKDIKIIIHNAQLANGYDLENKAGNPSLFDYVFEVLPTNDDADDLFEMVIKER